MSLGVPCATNRTKITSFQKLDFILQIGYLKKKPPTYSVWEF